jgi:hypothetical protein
MYNVLLASLNLLSERIESQCQPVSSPRPRIFTDEQLANFAKTLDEYDARHDTVCSVALYTLLRSSDRIGSRREEELIALINIAAEKDLGYANRIQRSITGSPHVCHRLSTTHYAESLVGSVAAKSRLKRRFT